MYLVMLMSDLMYLRAGGRGGGKWWRAALVASGAYLVIRELELSVSTSSFWEGRSARVLLNHRWPTI